MDLFETARPLKPLFGINLFETARPLKPRFWKVERNNISKEKPTKL